VDARREKRQRDFPVKRGRDCQRHSVDVCKDVAIIGHRAGAAARSHFRRARLVDVHDCRQLDSGKRGQNARVMAAEVPHADDGYSHGHRWRPLFITKTRR
jgi:hypothetical protein